MERLISKSSLIISIFVILPAFVNAQKVRVPEPKEIGILIKPDFLKDEKLTVLVYDGRVLPKNTIEEYESDSLTQNIFNYLKKTFPSMHLVKVGKELLYNKPTSKELFIKLKVTNFQVSFGGTKMVAGLSSSGGTAIGMSGEWNALVSYSVTIFDNRNEPKTINHEIQEVSSGPTMMTVGITSKNLMTKAYAQANKSLVNFIEDSFNTW